MSTENGKILNHLLFCTSILDSFFKLSEGRFSVFFMPFLKKIIVSMSTLWCITH